MEGDVVWEAISPEAKTMVRKLLCPDPKKRLTVEQALKEPWILSMDQAKRPTSSEEVPELLLPAPALNSEQQTTSIIISGEQQNNVSVLVK